MLSVQMPAPEQILVWQRSIRRLQQTSDNSWDGESAMKAMERMRKIIDSILSPEDVEWLDERMLDRETTMQECSQIVVDAIKAFSDEPEPANRAQRRAAPRKAAARKRATPRARNA